MPVYVEQVLSGQRGSYVNWLQCLFSYINGVDMCSSTTLDELYLARGVPEYLRTQGERSYIESFDLFYQNRDRIVRALERKMTAISKSYSLINVE